ncbi:LacI family DNA-binding transcriptional regulator [Saccharopolyspora mangrovi]|uniref:LacI family DNA-binding transcriptional regulator n=1 Tax=Saccharopolyspora mangrovi TaxID=3082379 RepID=A0ABU6AD33_9PSEU|nr:LacI family DNA-binding transcriptional regulator [Saccharopolyspora sp. S2-29]MEB3369424.1 LacI family DNA-binding transcriptional regulator [Saccharopolyspora sp. S2-29]
MRAGNVTLYDVAAAAGVSPKTVSRVINGAAGVSAATREQVQATIDELNYRPNFHARSLRVGRDEAIGVVLESLSDPFFATMASVIEEQALERGHVVLASSVGGDPEREHKLVQNLLQRQVSGLIMVPVSRDQSYLRAAAGQTPVVFVDRPARSADGLGTTVLGDDFGAAAAATEHLLHSGHTEIALIGDRPDVYTTAERIRGYRSALAESRVGVREDLIKTGVSSAAEARRALDELLRSERPPTAVFSSNARCSLGVVPALHARGRPDIAFVSFGDFPMADSLYPAVTVVDQDPAAVARTATQELFKQLDGAPAAEAPLSLPLRLVARGSGEIPLAAVTRP